MSEYLTFTLWRQREERMPHELEHQRVVQERLQQQEQELNELPVPTEREVAEVTEQAEAVSRDEYALVDE